MTAGEPPEQGEVEHVREPGDGVPVAGVAAGEGPIDVIESQARLDARILRDIKAIVVIHEIVPDDRPVEQESHHRQHVGDGGLRANPGAGLGGDAGRARVHAANSSVATAAGCGKRGRAAGRKGEGAFGSRENRFEERSFSRARRKQAPVMRQPKPYLILRRRLIEEASAKYFVGQVTSAMACPCQMMWASI